MEQNKFSNETSEQVIIFPTDRRIKINNSCPERAYALFDSETGTQIGDFVKGTDEGVEFKGLDTNKYYDVGAIENMGDGKPQFAISWNMTMRDDRDAILNDTDNSPVQYPCDYRIIDNQNNSKGIFDLVDNDNKTVGQVKELTMAGDKPEFHIAWTFKMKDDSNK